MPSAKSLTARNLEALGALRLAELLIDIGSADPAVRRRLRLVLAGEAGAAEVAREVQKRLATLAKARSFIEWNKIKPLADDLAAQHRAIVDIVAKADPRQAVELLWRFMELVDPVMARCDDSNGRLAGVFGAAAGDLAPLALAAEIDPGELARNVFGAVRGNGYGQFDGLIAGMADALGPHLRAHLKRLPDFDDVEAEDRAMSLALKFPEVHEALKFLVAWPALDRASQLVLARFNELNGDIYELLSPAGEALEVRYPLASTLVRRAMIDFILTTTRAKRYPHAARHLAECEALAARVADFGIHPTHDDYRRKLRIEHGRKTAFWQDVQSRA